jgi:sterol desaturase/sphingolipid hydroxylase (fatty acid hydroxylase superfamily)
MFNAFIQFIESSFEVIWPQLLYVLTYPFIPTQRIFWLYILSSSILAFYVFYVSIRLDPSHRLSFKAFISFLLPKDVWLTSSAWLDVRYFFVNQIFRMIIYGAFLAGVVHLTLQVITGGPGLIVANGPTFDSNITTIVISTMYMFVLIAFVDFVSYGIHYLQHKVPFLWEFHKVHHSLEVMHPLSNYREHPIDSCVYAIGTGAAYGLITGLSMNLLSYVPSAPQVLGVSLLLFAFNILGYNLRHSHVWLRWPGQWSMLFASPAHHHIHHSCHPDHINKNFAFMFPCWDVLFRTYHLPETNKDVRFGISMHHVNEYKSCIGIYFIPFRHAFAPVFKRLKRIFKKSVIIFYSKK